MSNTNESFVTQELKSRLGREMRLAGFSEELALFIESEIEKYARTGVGEAAQAFDDAAEKLFATTLRSVLPSKSLETAISEEEK